MKTGIFLSYKGLGANLLHLSYCHEIAKKFGPIKLITLNSKVAEVLSDDDNFNEIIYLENYYKKLIHINKLSQFLKKFDFENFFIFYPSIRYFLSSKLAGIPNIYHYPLFKKKGLHLVNAAKEFTEKTLKIKNCPTETKIFLKKNKFENLKKDRIKRIVLITSSFHMPRAKLLFDKQGIDSVPFATDFKATGKIISWLSFLPSANGFSRTSDGIREYIGRLYYKLKFA